MYLPQPFTTAIREADKVRMEFGLDIYEPMNIFDLCIEAQVSVRFVDVNMEGMFIDGGPTILVSNQRPYPRRCFTCAHEYGHLRFGHGTKVDALSDEQNPAQSDKEEELLVDSFAGALLMPVAGIQAAFAIRKINIKHAGPLDFFTIASLFGTGYQTLIVHCRVNRLISFAEEKALIRHSPAKIFESIVGMSLPKSYCRIIDEHAELPFVDIEVSNYLILPPSVNLDGNHLEYVMETPNGVLYRAITPGVLSASSSTKSNLNFKIRIQRSGYVGLAEYRHFPEHE